MDMSKKAPAKMKPGEARTSKRAAQSAKPSFNGKSGTIVPSGTMSIGEYLIERLYGLGIRHIFGVPGDYVLHFYEMLNDSKIRVINTTREDCAGFAADAYARVQGLGAVCVTYCVGGFNLCNSVACAYAEKSPVVVISGAPGITERANNPIIHHRVGDFSTQKDVFEKITVASTMLDDPWNAFREIDRVLGEAKRRKGPVYIELPRDRVDTKPLYDHKPVFTRLSSDRHALDEALAEVEQWVARCKKPLILAGVEIHRFGLQNELITLAEKTSIPIATSIMGKSVIAENHPLFIGLYEGRMCRDELRQYVEESDCIFMLGCALSDIDTGGDINPLDMDRCIYATSEYVRVRRHHYQNVLLSDFMHGLLKKNLKAPNREPLKLAPDTLGSTPPGDSPVTVKYLFTRLNEILDKNMIVIADIGDCLFAAGELSIHRRTEFLSPAYYTSMGFAVPGAVGAAFARPDLRQLVVVGDGAFQMTGTELSTIARHGFNPIVIVLNNRSYGTEEAILKGPFNELHEWQYDRIPELLGRGWGCKVKTERDLDIAIKTALANSVSFSLINVLLSPDDRSPALERLAKRLNERL
jgi:indolepyruvate decarboxylase